MLPILFSIGPIHIYSLSICIIVAWCFFSFAFWKSLRAQAIAEEHIFDLMFYGTIAAFVAGRAGFVALHWELFRTSLLKIAALWIQPGLAFFPAVAAGVIAMLFLSARYHIRRGVILDSLASSLPIPFAIGFIGATLGGSVVGTPTRIPWGVNAIGFTGLRHPVGFLFALAYMVLYGVIRVLFTYARRRDWAIGLVGVWFFLLVAIVHFTLEFMVVDRVYWKLVSANQWMSVLLFSQAVGAFYVRGGGKEFTHRLRQRLLPLFHR